MYLHCYLDLMDCNFLNALVSCSILPVDLSGNVQEDLQVGWISVNSSLLVNHENHVVYSGHSINSSNKKAISHSSEVFSDIKCKIFSC